MKNIKYLLKAVAVMPLFMNLAEAVKDAPSPLVQAAARQALSPEEESLRLDMVVNPEKNESPEKPIGEPVASEESAAQSSSQGIVNIDSAEMNDPMLQTVLNYLSESDLANLAKTNKALYKLVQSKRDQQKSSAINCKMMKADNLRMFFASHKNITNVQLRDATNEDLAVLPTNLTSLILSGCTQITNGEFLKSLPNLTSLDLSGCTQITNGEFLKSLPNLTSLNLSLCKRITNWEFLRSLPNLTWLNLGGCFQITSEEFLRYLPSLTSLDLSLCNQITDGECLRRLPID
ncbi:MAG: hypothetical protein A2007_05505 [Verrucomicrobia bacterium GWC2_42_7]|nr:MAG: hypothetical protein A2007_05505 [Verrucomicrobia bacterium GWC2_42_7]